jgi:hypothetical protein
MLTDSTENVVIVEVAEAGHIRRLAGRGPTLGEDGVTVILRTVLETSGVNPRTAQRIYSEWEPSPLDMGFIAATFPNAAVTYSFKRPTDGNWDLALSKAADIISASVSDDTPTPPGRFVELPPPPARATSRPRWWHFWRT